MTRTPTYSPHFIKASAKTADLLADIDNFEALGCNFGLVTTALVRAKLKDPRCTELTVQNVTFWAVGLRERLIIFSHVAKLTEDGKQTLRPFAELLVTHGLTQARLISPNTWSAWVEVSKDGTNWRKLKSDPPPAQPAPVQVIDAAMPPQENHDNT